MSCSNWLEDTIMTHLSNGTSWTKPSTLYVKLHTGDPGEDCADNAAEESTRKLFTLTGLSNGVMSNAAIITWTGVAESETYTHVSTWTASSGGNPLLYGPLTTPYTVTQGDDFNFAVGALSLGMQ